MSDSPQDTTIGTWLESIGMGQYAAGFNENHLTLDMLGVLTDTDLKECGVNSLRDRKQILAAIQQRTHEAAQPAPMPATEAGQPRKLGHFELLEKMGSGGMGTVYRAWDSSLNRQVAIKLLDRSLAADQPEFFQDFIREAQNAAGINHPHIVQIYFVGEDAGDCYIAMELLEGQTLDDRLKRGPIDEANALKIGKQTVEALAATNARRLIHGDIKPQNIFLTKDGDVKLLDFGLARKAQTSGVKDGSIMGSAYYISPERSCGLTEDFRSDIYSLGATMFHAISGMYSFEADDVQDLVRKRLEEDAPRLRSLKPNASAAVDQLLAKMLARDPAERHQSYQELLAEFATAQRAVQSGFDPGKKLTFAIPGGAAPVPGASEAVAEPQMMHAPQSRVITRSMPVATGSFAAAVPVAEPPKSKRGFWTKLAGSKILVISIILHLLFGAGATLLIVQRIQAKRKLVFQGGPGTPNPSTRALEHKVNMSRKQQTMSAPAQAKRITTTGISKISLPDMPSLPSATELTPGKMGGMGGTGVGFGPGGGGGGGGGTGKGMTMFGIREPGNGLAGNFYDLKQNKDRKPTGMDPKRYTGTVYEFVRGGFREGVLEHYYRAPATLYAPMIMMPIIPADEGPKAFGVENEVKPGLWVALYQGRVVAPESGNYYFVGAGDDLLIVRFNGRVVLDRCWEPQVQGQKPACKNTKDYHYGWLDSFGQEIPNGFARGASFSVIKGQAYKIEVLIGEQPGGLFSAALLLEKDGATYEHDDKGNPILPVFRVLNQPPPPSDKQHSSAPHMMDGPVWQTKPAGGLGL